MLMVVITLHKLFGLCLSVIFLGKRQMNSKVSFSVVFVSEFKVVLTVVPAV